MNKQPKNQKHVVPIIKRIIKSTVIAVLALTIFGALAFYILIISGLVPSLQRLWICTAMSTMHHQYLATMLFPEEKIEQILDETRVDDSGYATDITQVEILEEPEQETVPETVETPIAEDIPEPVDTYIEEGYRLLEQGIYLKDISGEGWKGHLMLITDPARVRLEDTANQFVCGQKVSTMVRNAGAVAGINGGGFSDGPNYDSNGGTPSGIVITEGKIVYPTAPEEITGNTYNMIGLNSDGILVLRHCTPQWAIDNGIVSAVSFGPFVIVNGDGVVKNGTGGWGIAPRTAIGQRKTGEIIFLVIDGRQVGHSIGVDILPVQETLLDEKCINAAMMDGGSSTVMIYNDEIVNKPCLEFERYINNCWVVMPQADSSSEQQEDNETQKGTQDQ